MKDYCVISYLCLLWVLIILAVLQVQGNQGILFLLLNKWLHFNSEWLLINANSVIFQLLSWWEQVIFQWNYDDEVRFVLDQLWFDRSGLELTIYRTRGKHANHYTYFNMILIRVILKQRKFKSEIYERIWLRMSYIRNNDFFPIYKIGL
jgi:hypothetical protein